MRQGRQRSTKPIEHESLGRRIRRLRQQRGLTIKQLAARCQSSVGYISQLENDPDKSMSLTKVRTFAQALQVPEQVLLGSHVDEIPQGDREFITWFLGLPSDAKNTFKALMDWYIRGKGQ